MIKNNDAVSIVVFRKEITMPLLNKFTASFLVMLYVMIGFVGFSQEVFANGELNFSVRTITPESQFGDDKGYFDVELQPGETEELTLVVKNVRNIPIDLSITAHTAYTNINGVVEYGGETDQPDPTLKVEMKDLLDVEDEPIRLEAGEEKRIVTTLTMPQDEVEGLLAGGLQLSEVAQEEEEEDSEDKGMQIINSFSYVIGVVASNDRTQTIVPELALLDVFADQINYRNAFSATIQNFLPTFVNELSVEASIRREGSDTILYRASEEMMQMAPNSNFNFPISLNGERFRSGTYVLNMTARSGEHEWTWEETFDVTADEARRLNQSDVSVKDTNWWLIAAIVLIVIIISVLAYTTYKNKKKAKLMQEKYMDTLSENKTDD
ncbi:DUF916 and DUF3324 domain-containing protein [Enterococcus mundtii]|nr:DUF916 and DUF3324 domain-containing protein [Enterococcus mundtii]